MAEEFPDFELIPAEADELSPDEELANLTNPDDVADLDTVDDTMPIGTNWLLDTDTGWFGGAPLVVTGVDSVVQVAQVALRTPRGQHVIFDDEFGMDHPEALIGHVDEAERRALYMRDISETLLACHDRITGVGGFDFLHDEDDEIAFVNLTIEIDGEEETRLEGVPLSA